MVVAATVRAGCWCRVVSVGVGRFSVYQINEPNARIMKADMENTKRPDPFSLVLGCGLSGGLAGCVMVVARRREVAVMVCGLRRMGAGGLGLCFLLD